MIGVIGSACINIGSIYVNGLEVDGEDFKQIILHILEKGE